MCVSVYMCVHVYVCCVCMCVWCMCVCVCVCVCVRADVNACHAPGERETDNKDNQSTAEY